MRARLIVGALVATAVLLLVLANAHLVYVAVSSQPECVDHARTAGEAPGTFRAARPSC